MTQFLQSLSFWWYLGLATLLNLVYAYSLGLKYRFLLGSIEQQVKRVHSFFIILVAKFSTFITPFKAGTVLTRPLATKYYTGLNLRSSFVVTVFEQFFDLGWQLVLLPILILFAGKEIFVAKTSEWVIIVSFLTLLSLTVILRKRVVDLVWWGMSFSEKVMKKMHSNFDMRKDIFKKRMNEVTQLLTDKRFVLRLIPYLFIQIFLIPLVLQYVLFAFDKSLSYGLVFIFYWLPTILGRLSGIPGGFISTDIVMGTLFYGVGFAPKETIAIILAFRFATLLPYFLIGAPLFAYITTRAAVRAIKKT